MPATWTPFNGSDPLQTIPWALLELEARSLEIRSCAVGPAAPTNPVDGMLWIQNDAIPWKPWFYGKLDAGEVNATWHALWGRLTVSINADPDPADGRAAPLEHKALRIENVGALPAAVDGNRGLLVIKTGNGEVYVSENQVAAGWKGLLSVKEGVSLDTVDADLETAIGNDGVNPPTATTRGVWAGWLFDAVAEKRTLFFHLPLNYDGLGAVKVRLWQLLGAGAIAGDDIEWDAEYRVLKSQDDVATKAATVIASPASVKDVGADAQGIADGGGPHVNEFSIPQADATNPLAAGAVLAVTVNRKTVGGAGKAPGTIAFFGELAYPQRVRHERA